MNAANDGDEAGAPARPGGSSVTAAALDELAALLDRFGDASSRAAAPTPVTRDPRPPAAPERDTIPVDVPTADTIDPHDTIDEPTADTIDEPTLDTIHPHDTIDGPTADTIDEPHLDTIHPHDPIDEPTADPIHPHDPIDDPTADPIHPHDTIHPLDPIDGPTADTIDEPILDTIDASGTIDTASPGSDLIPPGETARLPPATPHTTRPAAATSGRRSRHARPSRWDRPAPPHDWRYVVGGVGRILIVVGLLMFGFVAYQLWGTGLETARAQSRLESQFEAIVDEAPSATTAPTTPSTADDATTPSTPEPASTTAPTDTTPPSTVPDEGRDEGQDEGVDQVIPPILPGQAIAKLEIPRIDKAGDDALYVLPGVDYKTLHDGPGHYPDTPLPGQLGNAAIAGHRSTSGAPFADVDRLVDGDEIIVTMLTGDRFVYEVTDSFIVDPDDYWVVATTDPSVAQLTLTSCHPRFSARQRIIVRATLRPEASAPAGRPTYYDLGDETADEAGADAGQTVVDDTATDGAVATTTPPTTVVDGAAVTLPTEPVSGVPDGSGSVVTGPDALTAGWFHDSAAWPHIVAWAALCALIAFGAARLSRRFRSYPRGWAIAVVPFVVSLYFVYQNVNRLLPPGI